MRAMLLLALATAAVLTSVSFAAAKDPQAKQTLPLTLRTRDANDHSAFGVKRQAVQWDPAKTAAIVCDMWDKHWCAGATRRVEQMAPRMNELLGALRKQGVLIVHAPSGTMGHYADQPGRKLAQSAPTAKDLPDAVKSGCRRMDTEKGATWPVDQSDGGCDCQPKCKSGRAWSKQIEAIEIREGDAISDSGVEIWNLLAQRGVDNVLMMGVHTNMCVVGRPFGLRNLARCGKNVALVRDLTDAMYNSRKAPFVNHFRGTELVIQHIEKYICPTTTSADVLGGRRFRFPADTRPRILVAVAEREYLTWETLPAFARQTLANRLGCSIAVVWAAPEENRNVLAGFAEELAEADLLLLSARRRALPEADLKALRAFLDAGKPLVGIRTASHAFDTKGKHPDGHAEWRDFDPKVLGGNYHGHHGQGKTTTVTAIDGAAGHPILAGVKTPFATPGSLYKTSPLEKAATPLLTGRIPDQPAEPIAWTNTVGKSRIFYTSLGHADDFSGDDPPFVRLLSNAIFWALDRPIPKSAPPAKD